MIITAEMKVFMAGSIASFPHNGKSFRDFSTQWKKCFHSVENRSLKPDPQVPAAGMRGHQWAPPTSNG
jgi:hypothetical protein